MDAYLECLFPCTDWNYKYTYIGHAYSDITSITLYEKSRFIRFHIISDIVIFSIAL